MKTFIFIIGVLSLAASSEARRKIMPLPDNLYRYPFYHRHHPLILRDSGTPCTICIMTLQMIKTQLPQLEEITKHEVQVLLREVCNSYASFFEDVCISMEEKLVSFVLDLIVKYGENIDPIKNCEFLHICDRETTTTTTTTVAPTTTVAQITTEAPTTNTEGPSTTETVATTSV